MRPAQLRRVVMIASAVILTFALEPLLVDTSAYADRILFSFIGLDGPGEGLNDPVLGPARVDALLLAGRTLGSFFESSFPGERVRVEVSFDAFAGGAGDFYAFGSPELIALDLPVPGRGTSTVDVPRALLQHLARAQFPAPPDVHGRLTFNEAENFFLGLSGDPGDRLDLVTAAMHELGHVFGFVSGFRADGTIDFPPNLYDFGVVDAAGVPLIDLSPEERAAAVTSGNGLFWDAQLLIDSPGHAVAANAGARPNLSAGTTFVPGRNVVHLSEDFGFADALMSPFLAEGEVIRSLHPVEAGMFRDMGWQALVIPEPSTVVLVGVGFGGVAVAAWRRRRSGRFTAGAGVAAPASSCRLDGDRSASRS